MRGDINLFYSYSKYLKALYKAPAYRVSIDAGFSCPNREAGRAGYGCTYCDEYGARAMYIRKEKELSIKEQVENAVVFLKKRYNAKILLLYFQAFSGTFAKPKKLKEIYDYTLSLADFKELIVSTRPDCITEENADLLASYKKKGYDVWVELGLQSGSDISLKVLNRGHTVLQFYKAYHLLKKRGIKVAIHLIFGIPGETLEMILSTIKYVADLRPDGLKIHNLHIPYGTPIFKEYLQGEIIVPSDNRHLEYVIRALELLPPDCIIHRLTCDTPANNRAAPRNFAKKGSFYNMVINEMQKKNTFQGKLYNGLKNNGNTMEKKLDIR